MFGPQDEDDLIDQIELFQLKAYLPVLNGLLYDSALNCQKLFSDTESLKTLFGIFGLQFPVELHENALLICQNMLLNAKPAQKEKLVKDGMLIPLI